MFSSKSKLLVLLGSTILFGAGCNQGCWNKQPLFKQDVDQTEQVATTTVSVEPFLIERVPVSLAEPAQKFILKKEGVVIKEIIPVNNELFTMRIFKETDKFIYVAGYHEGVGGYTLFETDPTILYQVNKQTNDVVDVTRKGMIVEDIYGDDLLAWADIVNKAVVVQYVGAVSQIKFDVPKKYSQFGNIRFSPDGSKIAYAAAVGDVTKEGGVVYSADLVTGKQKLITEIKDDDKYFEIQGWKSTSTINYVDRGVNEK